MTLRTFSALLFLSFQLLGCAGTGSVHEGGAREAGRRVLVVSVYPYVPDAAKLYWSLETAFETANPGLDLRLSMNPDYYADDPSGGILHEQADVYELDSVFLEDFLEKGKLQPLPEGIVEKAGPFVPLAARAAFQGGVWYGAPHWVCGNFLFYRKQDAEMASVASQADLARVIGSAPAPGAGLLIDMKGASTLGELYLNAAFYRYSLPDSVLPRLASQPTPELADDLRGILALASPGFGRDEAYHNRTGFYARQFARGRGRALVGYSEALHHTLGETANACLHEEKCLGGMNIGVKSWPPSDAGAPTAGWVDLFVIDARVEGQKLSDAKAFIRFMLSDEAYRTALLPEPGGAPRYLLPAREAIYRDPAILAAAPLYPAMRALLADAVPLSMPGLNQRLLRIGEKLDAHVLP